MTIAEAIGRLDALKPNAFTNAEKLRWLSALDGLICREIIQIHEGGEEICFDGYDEKTDPMRTLLVPAPYDEMYLRYMEMQMDYANEDYTKYNNSLISFSSAYSSFERFYNRNNMARGERLRFFP